MSRDSELESEHSDALLLTHRYCRMVVNARSGGLNLLSLEAFVVPDPASRVPKGMILSSTKTYYEADPDILPQDLPTDVTIDFIRKSYSPTVDFGLYHSEGRRPDAGNAGISVNIVQPGNVYENNDPPVDIKQFIKMPVNPNAMDDVSGQNQSTSVSQTATQSVSGQNASGPVGTFSTPIVLGQKSNSQVVSS